jgi:hypothetical protein
MFNCLCRLTAEEPSTYHLSLHIGGMIIGTINYREWDLIDLGASVLKPLVPPLSSQCLKCNRTKWQKQTVWRLALHRPYFSYGLPYTSSWRDRGCCCMPVPTMTAKGYWLPLHVSCEPVTLHICWCAQWAFVLDAVMVCFKLGVRVPTLTVPGAGGGEDEFKVILSYVVSRASLCYWRRCLKWTKNKTETPNPVICSRSLNTGGTEKIKYCHGRAQPDAARSQPRHKPRGKENTFLLPNLRQKVGLQVAPYLDLLPSQNTLHLFISNLRLKTRQKHFMALQWHRSLPSALHTGLALAHIPATAPTEPLAHLHLSSGAF